MVISLAVSALVLAGVVLLLPLGLRAGDRPGDALLLTVEPLTAVRGVSVTVANPGSSPVIFGMSLRRAGRRFWVEGPSFVRVRTGRTSSELLPGSQASIGVLSAGEARTVSIPAAAAIGRRAELVVVIGQSQRLRAIHRLVVLSQEAGLSEAAIANSWAAGMSSAKVLDTQ